ncbi:hypothetical protein GCM10010123_01850 [Pilimelia anulata]|uniref:YbaK/aminoacyl-tRNA synthetase-associated domain-containing protein n=1 Tax=Pilimelia anulata TaxID=53371 RepID=A0A8J3F820_9ACTN|nr:YbaK/EbsC family protein [Pilimelia anulata]GGJ75497.1 hypothetical protein GCM10010123_01850 [Pilimelia anulata]
MLQLGPALARPDLLADPVIAGLQALPPELAREALVAPIDPALADTAAFCQAYRVALDESANCVIVAGRRGDITRYAACVVLATTRADVNGLVRRRLDARKASFAPMDQTVSLTGMEHGGITPVGLPERWTVLIDTRIDAYQHVIIGSGVRHSKLLVTGRLLAALPGAEVVERLGTPAIGLEHRSPS